MPHVDEGGLHAYLDGELAGVERDQVLAHLSDCAACRTRLDEARALVTRAGELLGRAAPPARAPAPFKAVRRSRAPSWRVPVAWAATVTIAFAVGWYAQGERIARQVGGEVTEAAPTASVAKATGSVAPSRAEHAPAPPAASPRSLEGAAAPPRRRCDCADGGPVCRPAGLCDQRRDAGRRRSRALLGQAPAVLQGHAVRRMTRSPTDDGVVVIEQEWRPGVVLRLYERRASTPPTQRARVTPGALALPRENLARYFRSLRVEIAGPLASDSLAQLLDSLDSAE